MAIGAALLLPLVLRGGQLRWVLRYWRPALAFAFLEILAPWLLLSDRELRLSSSTTGQLIAAAPILGVAMVRLSGTGRLGWVRWAGMLLILAGCAPANRTEKAAPVPVPAEPAQEAGSSPVTRSV
ncbi:EamA family transporter [Amycolatopsis sp. NPDC003861]